MDDSDQLAPLREHLPAGSSVLDAGCGAGRPITRALAERYRVTGLDASIAMLHLARAAVAEAHLLCADLARATFPAESFDAVVSIYVLFHLPREEHAQTLRRIHDWLRPGGYLLISLTENAEEPYTKPDFFGVPMYWSHFGWRDYERILQDLGFAILGGRIIGHGYGRTYVGRDERHPLVLARKRPRAATSSGSTHCDCGT